ncbi:hypothetical protein ABL840_24290 [Variovorax sp. NFACC27]|uniref:hypothetical protein n=1 Tax=unclassified Variovorax TaxID=663243 RepID=UPI000899189E|nr:hypothetical protein [Variovorax sp. YR750]SEF31966.1 hypothetical protein SAMN03159371_05709 [Variovorax sp. NFACC28]SEG91930.1 hypothetical protein SAMN03159365_05626 [Variovorax sp. NFACC29]SFD52942.1 hypothetical protein SAMN03159379_05551 [Variovorax sp. NFACC26]SFG70599.1 hypothetical protein SAMN03159447_04485 [Variovorax sp. NFACC27]SEL41499.1 hypothetical protein SAMN05518845_10776 [Variovorax sp. YR750]
MELGNVEFEGIYCFDTASVRFAIYPDGPDGARILAQISENTLHDEFGVREMGEQLTAACRKHFDAILPAAIARYRADPHQPVTLTHADFRVSPAAPAARAGR